MTSCCKAKRKRALLRNEGGCELLRDDRIRRVNALGVTIQAAQDRFERRGDDVAVHAYAVQRRTFADAHFNVGDGRGVCTLADRVLVIVHDFHWRVQLARDGGHERVDRSVAGARGLVCVAVDNDFSLHFDGFWFR